MSNFIVRKVAVLGAGVMGAQIAAHCVNARVAVVLFDLPAKEGPKDGIALRAIEGLKKLNPAPLGDADDAICIEAANYDDHLELLKDCDLIVEAIAERMDWKHALYQKVAPFIAPDAIFASNTSGLSITALSEGFSEELKARFCGVHFFNPPRYMHLVELIATAATRPEILDRLEGFLVTTLGKGVVRAKDTPNFIANRVGVFSMLATMQEAEKFGLTCDVVDDLTGAKLGRARSGVHAGDGSWSPACRLNAPRTELPVYRRQVFRAALFGEDAAHGRSAGTTVFEDQSVRIWHQDDGVLILSLKTRMHIIDAGIIAGLGRAIDEAERNYQGLVIWAADAGEGGAFSAGADLQWMLSMFMSGGVKAIEPGIDKLQRAFQAMKYANVPVVAAVAGLALGGGCELLLHAAKRVAAMESYIGLVEVGVGLIPAGGGLKEAALRAAADAKGNDLLQFLKNYFMHVATAAVSKSALEARRMGYLKADDVIVCNPYELLHVARSEVRAMADAGYRPPLKKLTPVAGRYAIANIMAQLVNLRDGGFISAHDFMLGQMIASVMAGGDVDQGSLVSEQWLLDLERRFFMELLDHPKTQERIMGMLQTGKPVRN